MEKRNRRILRCPACAMGRIADAPMEADLSQYHLFGMREGSMPTLSPNAPSAALRLELPCPIAPAFPLPPGRSAVRHGSGDNYHVTLSSAPATCHGRQEH